MRPLLLLPLIEGLSYIMKVRKFIINTYINDMVFNFKK